METPEASPKNDVAEVIPAQVPTAGTVPALPALPTDFSVDQRVSLYANDANFKHAQRVAKALAASTMVPDTYQNNIPNSLVALEMSNRMNLSPLAVMQNLDIINKRPCWKSTFIISAINSCGKFFSLRFKLEGEGDNRSCYAYAKSKEDGEIVTGPPASISMAKKQGWYSKNGSKWPDMPELMLQYRAATFFGRLHAPEILNGMQTADEVIDTSHVVVGAGSLNRDALNAKLVSAPAATPSVSYSDAVEVETEDLGI
jgi:hypothetical protein